jgi:hypothetical protein
VIACIAVLAVGMFVGSFLCPVYGIVSGQARAPMPIVAAYGAVVVLVAGLIGWRRSVTIRSGREDFIIDWHERMITLPCTHGRAQHDLIPFENVCRVVAVPGKVRRAHGERLQLAENCVSDPRGNTGGRRSADSNETADDTDKPG